MANLVSASHYEHGDNSGMTSNPGANNSDSEGMVQKLVNQLDEKCNVKALKKVWSPRVEVFIRGMLVATFVEDSYGMASHMTEQIQLISSVSTLSPALANGFAFVALLVGIVIQLVGSVCLVTLHHVDFATKALMGWAVAQPIVYSQLTNVEFLAEAMTLLGGLFLLRAHLLRNEHDQEHMISLQKQQLIGRLLLPAMYVHCALKFLYSVFTAKATDSYLKFFEELSTMVVMIVVLISMILASSLVATGLKSRAVAVLLALCNLGLVLVKHPFFLMLSREKGEWKYNVENYSLPHIAMPDDFDIDVDSGSQEIYELHRYYFFLGLSSSAALMLLAQVGPGDMALQSNEVLLPIASRGRD